MCFLWGRKCVVTRRPLTAEVRVRFGASACGIFGGTGRGFVRVLRSSSTRYCYQQDKWSEPGNLKKCNVLSEIRENWIGSTATFFFFFFFHARTRYQDFVAFQFKCVCFNLKRAEYIVYALSCTERRNMPKVSIADTKLLCFTDSNTAKSCSPWVGHWSTWTLISSLVLPKRPVRSSYVKYYITSKQLRGTRTSKTCTRQLVNNHVSVNCRLL